MVAIASTNAQATGPSIALQLVLDFRAGLFDRLEAAGLGHDALGAGRVDARFSVTIGDNMIRVDPDFLPVRRGEMREFHELLSVSGGMLLICLGVAQITDRMTVRVEDMTNT